MVKGWRVGHKIPINVYDETGRAVCQCHNETDAALIVAAMNAASSAETFRKAADELNRLVAAAKLAAL